MVEVSVWAQELIDHVTEHLDNEREALAAYRELAERAADDRVRYLALRILDDEIAHHQQFADLREALREEVEHRHPPRSGRRGDDADRQELMRRTEELLELERADIKELRSLAKSLRKVEDTKWRSAMVEVMELDTRKHILLLEQIQELLREFD